MVAPAEASSYPVAGNNIAGTLNASGAVQSGTTVKAQPIQIAYLPGNGSYVIVREGKQSEFRNAPAIDATTPNIVYAEFVNTFAGGQENLLVTTPPASGTDRLNWVGQGLYFSTTDRTGGGFDVSADAFHYGYPTASGDVPTTGEATYSVAVLGFLTENNQFPRILRTSNPGLLTANFGTGSVSVDGIGYTVDLVTGNPAGDLRYVGTASIGSSGFSGNFDIGGIAGTWNGLFYGPAAREVGAAFRGSGSGVNYVGTLVGSRDPGFRNIPSSFVGLNDPAGFAPIVVEELENVTEAGDTISTNFFFAGGSSGGLLGNYNVSYRHPGIWSLANTFTYSDGDIDASLSNDAYTFYGDTDEAGGGVDGLQLLNTGSGNSLIELSYTKLGIWERGGNGSGDYEVARRYAVFGFETEGADVPTTGSASYTGVLVGAGQSKGADSKFYDLNGNVTVAIRFDSNEWDGTVTVSGQERGTNLFRDFGTWGSTIGVLSGNELQEAQLLASGNPIGTIFGFVFGPGAAEVGGGFSIDVEDSSRPGHQLDLKGIWAGKKD